MENKTCPCCGGAAHFIQINKSGRGYVACKICDMQTGLYDNEAAAWYAWNRRDGE